MDGDILKRKDPTPKGRWVGGRGAAKASASGSCEGWQGERKGGTT